VRKHFSDILSFNQRLELFAQILQSINLRFPLSGTCITHTHLEVDLAPAEGEVQLIVKQKVPQFFLVVLSCVWVARLAPPRPGVPQPRPHSPSSLDGPFSWAQYLPLIHLSIVKLQDVWHWTDEKKTLGGIELLIPGLKQLRIQVNAAKPCEDIDRYDRV
jgi:hypothetical protein